MKKKAQSWCFAIVLFFLICITILLKNYTNILGIPQYIYINNYTSKKFEKVSEIEYLELISPNDFSLNKIKYCTNLKELFIISNKTYKDLSFIGDLKINSFSFVGKAEDWSKIEELTALKELNLYDSNYSNLNHILMLNQLNVLTIQTDSYLNVDELSNLNNLEFLTIDIPNADISGLSSLKQVKTLCISNCKNVSDLNFLKNMDNVNTLKLLNLNSINDYEFLLDMKNLRKVELMLKDEDVYIDDIIALLEKNDVKVIIK